MQQPHFIGAVFCALFLAACGGAETTDTATPSKPIAEEVTQPEIPKVEASTDVSDETVATTKPKPNRGKIVFLRCRSCHTLNEGGAHLTGPNLYGLFGATAGKKDGYTFSKEMTSSTLVWNAETLDAWLKDPQGVMPGNNMAFAGLPKATDRAALIEYLQTETE